MVTMCWTCKFCDGDEHTYLLKAAILKTKKEIWRVVMSGCLCLSERGEKDGDEKRRKE
jgi:hypothetical protein